MAHIHTLPGQIDNVSDVFIVDVKTKTVLLRMHEKYHKFLSVGGHIELDETPEQAALREVKEEVGLDVKLWREYSHDETFPKEFYNQILPPYHMNIHPIGKDHRHLSHVYYAFAASTETFEQENEKSGGLKWWTKEELDNSNELEPEIKWYALDALDKLCN